MVKLKRLITLKVNCLSSSLLKPSNKSRTTMKVADRTSPFLTSPVVKNSSNSSESSKITSLDQPDLLDPTSSPSQNVPTITPKDSGLISLMISTPSIMKFFPRLRDSSITPHSKTLFHSPHKNSKVQESKLLLKKLNPSQHQPKLKPQNNDENSLEINPPIKHDFQTKKKVVLFY